MASAEASSEATRRRVRRSSRIPSAAWAIACASPDPLRWATCQAAASTVACSAPRWRARDPRAPGHVGVHPRGDGDGAKLLPVGSGPLEDPHGRLPCRQVRSHRVTGGEHESRSPVSHLDQSRSSDQVQAPAAATPSPMRERTRVPPSSCHQVRPTTTHRGGHQPGRAAGRSRASHVAVIADAGNTRATAAAASPAATRLICRRASPEGPIPDRGPPRRRGGTSPPGRRGRGGRSRAAARRSRGPGGGRRGHDRGG